MPALGGAAIPRAQGPLALPSAYVPASQKHWGELPGRSGLAWPENDLSLWREMRCLERYIRTRLPAPLTAGGAVTAADALAAPGSHLRVQVGSALPPADQLAASAISAEQWVEQAIGWVLRLAAVGPDLNPGTWTCPFVSHTVERRMEPSRTCLLLAVGPQPVHLANAAVYMRQGMMVPGPHDGGFVPLYFDLAVGLPEPYHVELVILGLHCTLAFQGVATAFLQAAGYTVVAGLPGRDQVQVVSEQLSGPESPVPSSQCIKACLRIGDGVDPALVQLPRQACLTFGTVRLRVLRPRPEASPEERRPRSTPAPPAAPTPPQPLAAPMLAAAPAVEPGTAAGAVLSSEPAYSSPQPQAFERGSYVQRSGSGEPYRVASAGPLGVAVVWGQDGSRSRVLASRLQLWDGEVSPAICPARFKGASVACELCTQRQAGAARPMILCDGCNTGWHASCLGIPVVPAGTWLCDCCTPLLAAGPSRRPPAPEAVAALERPGDAGPPERAVEQEPRQERGQGSGQERGGETAGASGAVTRAGDGNEGGQTSVQGGGQARGRGCGAARTKGGGQGAGPTRGATHGAAPQGAPGPAAASQPAAALQRGAAPSDRSRRDGAGPPTAAELPAAVVGATRALSVARSGNPRAGIGTPAWQTPRPGSSPERPAAAAAAAAPHARVETAAALTGSRAGPARPAEPRTRRGPAAAPHRTHPLEPPDLASAAPPRDGGPSRMDVDPLLGRRGAENPAAGPVAKRSKERTHGLQQSAAPTDRRRAPSGATSDSDSAESGEVAYGQVLPIGAVPVVMAAIQGPPEAPTGAEGDKVVTLAHQHLWSLSTDAPVCKWRVARERILESLKGDVDQWRSVAAEDLAAPRLPAPAYHALERTAEVLQAQCDKMGRTGVAGRAGGRP